MAIKLRESRRPALTATILALSCLGANAQLLGCDAVACPLTVHGMEYCPLGNITATSIGITNLSTAISPEPFTWTTTISSSSNHANSLLIDYERGFYLGTPASVNLSKTTDIEGCALFFEAISSSLHFPVHRPNPDVGTCQDALGASCVSDLMSQVDGKFSELIATANGTSNICSDLESALRDSAPRTCNATNDRTWGTISARAITGSSAPPPLRQKNCHPTTGANYSISLIETFHRTAKPIPAIANLFGNGVTPILTVFYSPTSTTNNTKVRMGQLETPEFHLSCLRPVSRMLGSHEVQGGLATLFRPDLRLAATFVLVTSAVALS